MTDWRDPASPGWTFAWGVGGEASWLEDKLGLAPGRYRRRPLGDTFELKDPHHGELHRLDLYQYVNDRTSARWKVAMTEVSNGIYVVGYFPEAR